MTMWDGKPLHTLPVGREEGTALRKCRKPTPALRSGGKGHLARLPQSLLLSNVGILSCVGKALHNKWPVWQCPRLWEQRCYKEALPLVHAAWVCPVSRAAGPGPARRRGVGACPPSTRCRPPKDFDGFMQPAPL